MTASGDMQAGAGADFDDAARLDIVAFKRKAVPGKVSARAGQANAYSPETTAMAWSTKRAFSPTGAT